MGNELLSQYIESVIFALYSTSQGARLRFNHISDYIFLDIVLPSHFYIQFRPKY
jgi:hypothetical protein